MGGTLFMDFKYADVDGWLGRRSHTDVNRKHLAHMLATNPELEMAEQGIFGDDHPGQPDFHMIYAHLMTRQLMSS